MKQLNSFLADKNTCVILIEFLNKVCNLKKNIIIIIITIIIIIIIIIIILFFWGGVHFWTLRHYVLKSWWFSWTKNNDS